MEECGRVVLRRFAEREVSGDSTVGTQPRWDRRDSSADKYQAEVVWTSALEKQW